MAVNNETCERPVNQNIDLQVQRQTEKEITNQIQIELRVKTEDFKKAIFKLDRYDIVIVIIILVLCALLLLLCTFVMKSKTLLFTYVFVIGYGLSLCCSLLLNSNAINMKKRYLIIAISYAILLLIGIICLVSIKTLELFASIIVLFTSYWVILIIFQFEKGSGMSTTASLKYLYSIKALITPMFFHFADIATDIGTTIAYLNRSNQNDIQSNSNVDYNTIFKASVFILIFYRIISCLLVKYYTSSNMDCLLQFVDVYICKILRTEWKLNYIKAGRLHKFIHLTEAVFESAPFSIISLYIILVDGGSFIIWISGIFSVVSIAARTISQDERFFTPQSGAKTLDFSKKNKQCNKKRCLYCNWRYLLRLCWRILDVVSFVLLYPLIWYFFGFNWLLVALLWQMAAVIFANFANLFSGQAIELYQRNFACQASTQIRY